MRELEEEKGRELIEEKGVELMDEALETHRVRRPYLRGIEGTFEWGMWNGMLGDLAITPASLPARPHPQPAAQDRTLLIGCECD